MPAWFGVDCYAVHSALAGSVHAECIVSLVLILLHD